jgi:dolichol-phosphate mannosyltransferase
MLLIIIPTLNEEKNVKFLFDEIKKNKIEFHLLFVDDNSQDNTRKNILYLSEKYKNVFYIFRPRRLGIGSAHKDALKWAYKNKYDTIITMDGDRTHSPKYIRLILKFIKSHDIVTCSRFSKNFNSLKDWPLFRKIITRARHLLISNLLDMKLDASGAFRCYDTKVVLISDLLKAKNNSYSFFWESLFFLKDKYKIKEIEIKLPFRKNGSSKMKISDIYTSLFYLLKFYIRQKFLKI